ncbi:MAG: DNA-deoxyinosine glycosylase [Lachnospiraceae bacterium]|nr:DNA-deoxyinosine glycosylase [Lachnospiraceae bacterium]
MEKNAEKQGERIFHTFRPVYNEESTILILGSFPSVKSRENNFYYGHPQNRFWKVIAGVFNVKVPETIEEKKTMLLDHGIAIWDVIESCTIHGSSDSSIKDVIVNDFSEILENSKVEKIYVNGGKAYELYEKYAKQKTGIPAIKLPSTSPANAAWKVERLVEAWSSIKQ